MTKQMRQLYDALRDLTKSVDDATDDVRDGVIPLTPEIVSALQQGRLVVAKYEGAIHDPL